MKLDIFVSYSSKDRPFAERLAADLLQLGIKVWIDVLEISVGDSLTNKIQHAISKSAWLAVVLSPNSVTSPWVSVELNAALATELEKKEVVVLPILYRDCNVPLFLRDKVYADFRTDYNGGLAALLRRIKPTLKPRVLEKLMSGEPSKIVAAYFSIAAPDRPAYLSCIQRAVNDPSVGKRIAGMTALVAIKENNLVSDLVRMADDSSASVRRYAVFYLGELRAKDALPKISEKQSDKSPEVRATARVAYKKLRGRFG